MLELSTSFHTGEPIRIRTIAEEHGIPSRFLVQILLQLKGAGFVASTRGASGGYQLIKSPDEISLGEVMTVIEGQESEPGGAVAGKTPTARVLNDTWREIAQVEHDALYGVTFGELVSRVKRQSENMFYI